MGDPLAHGVVRVAGNEGGSVKLVPDGENRMKAVGGLVWTNESTVIVSITLGGAQPAEARFAPAAAQASGSAHSHGAGDAHRH